MLHVVGCWRWLGAFCRERGCAHQAVSCVGGLNIARPHRCVRFVVVCEICVVYMLYGVCLGLAATGSWFSSIVL